MNAVSFAGILYEDGSSENQERNGLKLLADVRGGWDADKTG
jgi:hypothetical protein